MDCRDDKKKTKFATRYKKSAMQLEENMKHQIAHVTKITIKNTWIP